MLVNFTIALDTALLFPKQLAWEDFSQSPPLGVAEEVDGMVPALLSAPLTLLMEALNSPIDERPSRLASLFASLPEEGVDHIPLDAPSKPKGMMRHWELVDNKGFRQKIENTLLGVDPVLPTIVFGITKFGALPNEPGVNSRNIWHSTLSITEHINRPRDPKDYHYIVTNVRTQGANDPSSFTTRMKAGECIAISSSAFRTFEKDYEEIKLRREMFARQLALDAKIENSTLMLQTREKALKADLQKQLQRGIEKKLRKATKSEKGWAKRFHSSTMLEVQSNWERRQDNKSGTIFFRNIPSPSEAAKQEKFMQTCQWEVPATWDGDPLYVPGDEYGMDDNDSDSLSMGDNSAFGGRSVASSITGAEGLGAFGQPSDSWHPAADVNEMGDPKGGLGKGKTPGNQSRQALGNRVSQGQVDAYGQHGVQRRGDQVGKMTGIPEGSYIDNEDSSILAERSLGVSQAATIDTANLEHIAEQLVSSDELMRILARRLGLPEQQVVSAEDLSVFSVSQAGDSFISESQSSRERKAAKDEVGGMLAPRDDFGEEAEEDMDSDDDLWSDDEQEAGDYDDDLIGDTPQNHYDTNNLRKKKMNENSAEEHSVPSQVPFLDLKSSGVVNGSEEGENGAGWRKLNRPDVPEKFFEKCK